MGLLLTKVLVIAKMTDFEGFAKYSMCLLISSSFCMLVSFGLQIKLQCEWPIFIIEGRERRGLILSLQNYYISLALFIILVLAANISNIFLLLNLLLIQIALFNGLANQWFLIATTESRSRHNSLKYSVQHLYRSIAVFVFGVGSVYFYNSPLLAIFGESLVTIILTAFYFAETIKNSNNQCNKLFIIAFRGIKSIVWRSPISQMIATLAGYLVINMDKWIAAYFLDIKEFAKYSYVSIILSVALSVQAIISSSFFPLIAKKLKLFSTAYAFKYTLKVSFIVISFGILSIPVIYFTFTSFTKLWYPDYDDTKYILLFFIFISILRVSDFWSGYILLVGKAEALIIINAISIIIGLAYFYVMYLFFDIKNQINLVVSMALITGLAHYTILFLYSKKLKYSEVLYKNTSSTLYF